MKVALRMVGHQILLAYGDSNSLVMPVERDGDRYKITFERDFALEPSQMADIINSVAQDAGIRRGYIVEIENCDSGEVVYSYEVAQEEERDIMPCMGRELPSDCYTIYFTLLNPVLIVQSEHKPSDSTLFADAEESQSDLLLSKKDKDGGLATKMPALVLLMLGLMTGGYFLFYKRKSQEQQDPNQIPLGDYRFDKRNFELHYQGQKIDLSGKEADLLLLLYDSVNATVEREVILNKVWGDKGDYVGRTLDVFISKLRKKLEADPALKIINIRGIGYKLVVNN